MKRVDLERRLRALGWSLLRHGGRHDVWSKGELEICVPRHGEIHENLARKIIREAQR